MIVIMQNPSRFSMVCDFCAVPEKTAKLLIASPNGTHICDECVVVCEQIVSEKIKDLEENT